MTDQIISLDGAAVQHGKLSDRVYILFFPDTCGDETVEKCEQLAEEKGYSKIIAKIPDTKAGIFIKRGFETEAEIPLKNTPWKKALFVSKFNDPHRRKENNRELQSEIILKALSCVPEKSEPALVKQCRRMTPDDAEEMAALYRAVFESYPFPVHDPEYIKETMGESVFYFGIRTEGRLTALASAEISRSIKAAEMTDFATLPEARGKGCASALLSVMEKDLAESEITSFYTIARSLSFGMNITFAKQGYSFCGRLVNNTNICGGTETMNVWHKYAGL